MPSRSSPNAQPEPSTRGESREGGGAAPSSLVDSENGGRVRAEAASSWMSSDPRASLTTPVRPARATRTPRFTRAARRVRRRYHLAPSTLFYVAITLVTAIGAFNSQNNLLFWALGVSFAAIIVSGVVSGRMLMGVSARRRPISPARVGEVFAVEYSVRNLSRRGSAFALSIDEHELLREGTPPPSSTSRAAVAIERSAGRAFMNATREVAARSEPRASQGRVVVVSQGFLEHIAPQHTRVGATRLRALRRGRLTLSAFRLHTAFPFGLIRKSVEFREPTSVLVRPALVGIKSNIAREIDQMGQSSRTLWRRPGPGDEFFALREYAEGDPLRSIAWRASARRMALQSGSELLVRQTSLPTPTRLWLVLKLLVPQQVGTRDPRSNGVSDPRAVADSGTAEWFNERAISVAASFARLAIKRGLHVGLAVPSVGLVIRPSGGASFLDRIDDELAEINLAALREAGFPHAASGRDTGCVVLHAGEVDRAYAPGLSVWHLGSEDCIDDHESPSPSQDPLPQAAGNAGRAPRSSNDARAHEDATETPRSRALSGTTRFASARARAEQAGRAP